MFKIQYNYVHYPLLCLRRPKQFHFSFSNRIVANLRSVRQLVLKFYKNPPSRYNYPSVVRKVPPSPNLGTSNSIAIS